MGKAVAVSKQAGVVVFPERIQSGGMSGKRLLGHMLAARINVGHCARVALQSEAIQASFQHEVGLTRCSFRELGFRDKPVRQEVWDRIGEIGALCRAEDGPHLRYQFVEQPIGDHFWIAMDPIPVGLSGHGIFYLYRSNPKETGIEICPVGDNVQLSLDTQIVFRSRI